MTICTLSSIDAVIAIFECNEIENKLINPDYIHQVYQLTHLQNTITAEIVKEIIIDAGNTNNDTNYELIHLMPLSDNTGCINFIYSIKVRDVDNDKYYEWILRICNPHSHFRKKTKWEIIVMNIVSKHCPNIKCPKVISYSDDIKKPPLIGYEYILMEKLNGISLGQIDDNLSQTQKNNIYIKWCSMIKELRSIPIPLNSQKIGRFADETMLKYDESEFSQFTPTNNLVDYHKMFFFDYIIKHLKYSYFNREYKPSFGDLFDLKTIQKLEKCFLKVIEKWVQPMQDIMDKYGDNEKQQQWFHINHNDWHYQNIFVTNNMDQCEIIALLDWEWSDISFFPMDPIFIKDAEEDWKIPQDIVDTNKIKLDHILYKDELGDNIETLRNVHRAVKEMVFYTVTYFKDDNCLNDMNALYEKIKAYKMDGFKYLQEMLSKLDCWL